MTHTHGAVVSLQRSRVHHFPGWHLLCRRPALAKPLQQHLCLRRPLHSKHFGHQLVACRDRLLCAQPVRLCLHTHLSCVYTNPVEHPFNPSHTLTDHMLTVPCVAFSSSLKTCCRRDHGRPRHRPHLLHLALCLPARHRHERRLPRLRPPGLRLPQHHLPRCLRHPHPVPLHPGLRLRLPDSVPAQLHLQRRGLRPPVPGDEHHELLGGLPPLLLPERRARRSSTLPASACRRRDAFPLAQPRHA